MSKVPPTAKPVNDLIKFWASQQEENEKVSEQASRSPRRPLSPNPDTSPSPKTPLSPTSPTLSPTTKNISVTNVSKPKGDNDNFQNSALASSTNHVTTSDYVNPYDENMRLRDPASRAKLATQMVQRGSLPRVKNVSDLVSKFEKVSSPPVSPTASNPSMKKGLPDIPESQPTSPKPMSPIKRNQAIEALSISQPLSDAISNTLVSQIKQRDVNPFELSISTSLNESFTTQPLYSPVKTPTSMKRRSNIPDPIVIPSPVNSKAPSSPRSDDETEKLTSHISSPIKSMVSPTIGSKSKSKSVSNPKSNIQRPKTELKSKSQILSPKRNTVEDLPQIRPTSDFDIDFLDPIFNRSFAKDITEEELSILRQKQRQHAFESKSVSSGKNSTVPTKGPKSPISPKGDSQKGSTSNLPQVLLLSSSGQETTVEVSDHVSSSPPIQSPNLGFTPVSSVPTSPEFVSSNFKLPEITPISPFWNPAAATGSNTVSPLWKPLPENQKKLISPILMPKPDNSLSQKISALKDKIISKKDKSKNNNNVNNSLSPKGIKSPDLWFKRSSSSFLKVPENKPRPVPASSTFTMQEPAPKPSVDGSDPTAHSYIFSFLSDGDKDAWKFFARSPNNSTTKFNLDLNPFSSYLDNIREDNDATDVENEDQNYNPFLDEQPDLEKEKKRKHISNDEIANSHAIEMQVTNIVHSRSTTKVDDENDSMRIDVSENNRNKQQRKSFNLGYNGFKRSKSTQSLDSVTKFKQKNYHNQHKYKPVQIPKSPYSAIHPQRHTLSPAYILKDNQNLLRNITVSNFTTITKDEKENIQGVNTSVTNTTELVNHPKFTINLFDEFEKNELFLPGTPWVHLPHLDEHIQSLPKTEFSNPKEVMTSEEYGKFLAQGNFHDNPGNLFPLVSQSIDDHSDDRTSIIQVKSKDENNNDGPSERGIAGPSHSPFSEKCQDTVSILYEQRFLRLEIIRDFIQFMAIALSFVTQGMFDNNKIYLILSSVPNFLSFNMDKAFGFGVIFFLIFSIIGFVGLFLFRKMANWKKVTDVENLKSPSRTSLLQNHILIFILTTLYAPLTKLSLDALVWSDSFWPIKNPYLPNVDFPDFDSMIEAGDGASRFPKDFCYVTSMKKDETNFSPFIIALGLLNLCVFTFWFPIKLKRIVNVHIRRFGFTENDDANNSPHKFLYNGYNVNWETYKSFIMGMKFALIFFVVVISKDNCLFRSTIRQRVSTATQVLKIIMFVLLLLPYLKSRPFNYSNFNTAECLARSTYLIASFFGLLIISQIGFVQGLGIALFLINIAVLVLIIWYLYKENNDFSMGYTNENSYGLSRSISSSGRDLGKKKLEFSLDISSPDLDFDRLIKERIWQDTWTKLLLLNDKFKPPAGKTLLFSEESYRTPYLLNFNGSVGERHIENSKILSEIGLRRYVQSLTILPSSIRAKIMNNYVGVDMYYTEEFPDDSKKTCFGKSYVIPFPFSIVMQYDEDDSIVVLTQEWEIQTYLQQNEDEEIQRSRLTRQMIRALEGKNIIGPCHEADCMKNKAHHHRGILSIQRKQGPFWREHDLNPGFEVTITYSDSKSNKSQVVGHDVIGITDDFKMTHKLERLFGDNYELIEVGLDRVKAMMDEYRRYYRDESRSKEDVLTYGFHINIFNNPSIPFETLPSLLINTEENQLIRSIPEREYPIMVYLYERMRIVHTSRVHQWWYLFWEDLWKNNGHQIPYLRKYKQDFSPLYRTSICYQPMKRSDLEEFMEKRGLWMNDGKVGLFHSGVLNKIYLYLNGVVFGRKGRDGSPKKWYISKENKIRDRNSLGFERKTIIDKVGVITGINRNSHNSKRPYYIMREEESDSDFEDVELDVTNNNNVSDDETLCYQ